ncbi:MAG TPA: ribulokinase [Euzebyales bacterium]|nr:ribulokinase [Euzebyales bacterium]
MAGMGDARYALGLDYGTNSVRALVVRCDDGEEVAEAVFDYPSGRQGVILDPRDPHLARQHPGDYIDGFYETVRAALADASRRDDFSPGQVVGIGVDTTGSTPIPVGSDGVPLALEERFGEDPHAQAWLWKDHTGWAEADEITALARERGEPYLAKCGGVYSSEWFWSKILHCKRVAPEVYDAAFTWVELADFVPAWITGNQAPERIVRSVCAAGHKALYHREWGGLPSKEFLAALDPELADLRDRLYDTAEPSSAPAGELAPDVAERAGLPAGIPVAVGAFDAHHGAVGAGVAPGTLVKILGTSTCDITVWPMDGRDTSLADIPGVCGIVPGSVMPADLGIEAGQSAVGDIFAWMAEQASSAEYHGPDAHERLTADAQRLAPGASGLLALDWHNGNRTILINPRLSGLIVGQSLHTTPPETYRAYIEATAFGGRAIIERLEEYGVKIETLVHCGGIAERNPFVNQLYADVLRRRILISRSSQTCALGAALFGAVVAGVFDDVASAQDAMTGQRDEVFEPDPDAADTYDELYALYRVLHDAFGGVPAERSTASPTALASVMPRLADIRDEVRARPDQDAS